MLRQAKISLTITVTIHCSQDSQQWVSAVNFRPVTNSYDDEWRAFDIYLREWRLEHDRPGPIFYNMKELANARDIRDLHTPV